MLSCSAACACDLHIEGSSGRLVLYEAMKRAAFMHMSGLSMAGGGRVFTSYHTPLRLTHTSLRRALISPCLSGFPSFLPTIPPPEDVTYAALPLCTRSSGNSEYRGLRLSGFFGEWREADRQSSPRSRLTGTRTGNQEGKYGLLRRMCVGSRSRNNTHRNLM